MIYEVVLSDAAIRDIEQAVVWYEERRKGLGYEFELSLEAGITFLERHPLSCPKKYKDIRVKFIKRFPYGLHYEVIDNSVKIIAVFHMKRSPYRWVERSSQKDLE